MPVLAAYAPVCWIIVALPLSGLRRLEETLAQEV
jgi:hypothetical protein